MDRVELTDDEAVGRLLRVIASRHARRAAAAPPDMNDPEAVLRWLEAAAHAAEEEFDRLMGILPPESEPRASRLQRAVGLQG
jgi:hypothetical protein